jgi:hypothetical protein
VPAIHSQQQDRQMPLDKGPLSLLEWTNKLLPQAGLHSSPRSFISDTSKAAVQPSSY